ncbi:MAG TPA: hypothetical protein VK497_01965 [Candidatus Saccharimonadales bacterium]|nr:hypothetical protein [Candidatus Saccharimonadales bacterium]
MTTKKSANIKVSPIRDQPNKMPKEGTLAIAAIILPFISWFVASLFNPSGWASHEPSIVITLPALLIPFYWPITLLLILWIGIYLGLKKASARSIAIVLLTLSVIYSAYIFQLTVSAEEKEFAA